MKPFYRILTLLLSVWIYCGVQTASATHFMGVDITYECLGGCIYRIYHNTYYDCSGAATPTPVGPNNAPPAPNINFVGTGGTNCTDPVALGTGWTFTSYMEVTPICPTATTECDGTPGQINGAAEARYYRDYDFCNVNCTDYLITWSSCCRNYSITSGASGNSIFSGLTEINLAIQPCNSSPQFSNPPVPYICQGQSFTFNQGAFDPDGDSLVYSLGPCFNNNATTQVGYAVGYSPTAPLGPTWNVSINSFTGDVTMTPNPTGAIVTGVMCVYVEEYRNGVKIGEVFRDMQITVIDCSAFGQVNNPPTIPGVIATSPNTSANGFNVNACACQEVCIDIPTADPDSGQTWTLFTNNNVQGVLYDQANPNVPVDTITSTALINGEYCWTPTQTGLYTLLLTIKDDGCPIIGTNQYTVVYNVGSCPTSNVAVTSIVGCYDVLFSLCGGAAPNTRYDWTGSGGLSIQGDSTIYTYPGPGTYNYTLSIFDSLTNNTLSTTGAITLVNTATADAGPDISVCPSQNGTIGTPGLPGYTYQWSSPGNQGFTSPTTDAQPTVSLNNGTTNPITLPFFLEATDINGCIDRDTVLVTFSPKPPSGFSINAPVCVNDITTAVYSSGQTVGVTFNWNYAGGTGTTIGPGPHQVSWNTPGVKNVSLWVVRNGCVSDTSVVPVTVNAIPTANFIVTSPVCAGQPSQITYTGTAGGGATYQWDFDGGSGTGGQGPFGATWTQPGIKDVSLTVIENGCVSPTTTQQITVNQVPTSTFAMQSTVCLDDQVQITYTGTGTGLGGFAWNFDGGQIVSGSGPGPYIVEWATPGVKTVCLQTEENGCISTLTCNNIQVLDPPDADIAPVSNQCFDGNSVNFVYTGDANATTYAWNFGADANPAISSSATPGPVSYTNPGPKTVSLVVTRNGCVSDTAFVNFEVVPDPEAPFTFSSGASCQDVGVAFQYTGTPVGPNQTYLWDFGQGAIPASSSQSNPGTVNYASGGNKSVTLTVNYRGCIDQTTEQVTIYESPQANAGPDKEFCDGEGGVQVTASVSGGTPAYFYDWTCDDPGNCGISNAFAQSPFMNPDITLATDTVVYYYQVTDVNGCKSNVDSVRVTVKAKPIIDAGPDRNICAEGPGQFLSGGPAANNNAPLPFTYQWSPAIGLNDANVPNPFARPDTTTIYTLVVTSTNGCTSEVTTLDTLSTTTVHVNALPIAEAGADTAICLDDAVQLAGSASGGGPNYSYAWTPAMPGTIDDPTSPSPNVSPEFTTTFFLVVSSNGCDSYADSVEVIVDTKPTLSPGSDESICQGDSVRLDGLASGDPFGSQYSYEWTPTVGLSDPGQGDPLAGPKQTTTYTVVATSEHGCGSDAKSILVTVESTPIVFILKPDTVVCEGDEINLFADHGFKTPSATPVVYDWQPQDGSIISSPFVKSIQIVPTTTTIYSVTATAPSGCATTDEVLVTVNPRVEATLSADTTQFCEGLATRLYAAGGLGNAEVQWLPSTGLDDSTSFNPFASPSENTTYQVVITEGACSDTAAVSLTINPAPIPDYFASQDAGCAGLEVSFMENATNGTNFLWDFGDGSPVNNEVNPSHVYAEPGSYPVTLTAVGPGGCEADITKTVVEVSDGAFADFSSSPEAMNEIPLPGATVQFTDLSANGVSWYWDFGDGNVSTAQNPTHTYAQAGEYGVSLTVTDGNGCTSTIQYGPYIIFNPDLMIPNLFSPNGDGTNDRFVVQYTGNESFMLEIFDRWGRTVFTSDAVQDAWEGQDSGGGLAREGVYYYSLQIGERMYNGHVTLLR
jgi:gliding motility-associated-like protein